MSSIYLGPKSYNDAVARRSGFAESFERIVADWSQIAAGCGRPVDIREDALVIQTTDSDEANSLSDNATSIVRKVHSFRLAEICKLVLRYSTKSACQPVLLETQQPKGGSYQDYVNDVIRRGKAFQSVEQGWNDISQNHGFFVGKKADALERFLIILIRKGIPNLARV